MNIKKQYSTRGLGTPSVLSGQNSLNYLDGYWYINGTKTNVTGTSINPSTDPQLSAGINKEALNKNLATLNARINAIHKELTYWDLYKLTASIEQPSDFGPTYSGLSNGQSLVINCDSFTYNGINFHKGDVLVKASEDTQIKVDAINSGIFYPQELSQSNGTNNFTLTYGYTANTPNKDGVKVDNNKVNAGENGIVNTTLKFNMTTIATETTYGFLYDNTNTTITLDAVSTPDKKGVIKPIIKTFTDNNEEVVLPITTDGSYKISYDTTNKQYTISGWTNCSLATKLQVK